MSSRGRVVLREETMSALYYVLGAVAKVNASMWRHRINFLPMNVLVIGVMVVAGFGTATETIESLNNPSTALRVSVAQIHEDANLVQKYVSVTGVDFRFALYEYGSKAASGEITRVDKSWAPLLDRASQRILLVQRAGKITAGEPQESTVYGMLRELDADVRRRLASQNDTVQGVPVETRYMLVAGEHPANVMTSGLISGLLFGGVALFLIAAVNRNTIFQRANFGSPVSKLKSVESLKVGGTGTFALEQSGQVTERRFVDMPSILARAEDGNPALFSNIDASSRFMGITTSERSGIWSLAMVAGSVHETEAGFLYWGTARRPAFRFMYASTTGAKRRAIVTADDVQALGAAAALITMTPAARGAPAT
jgi:hypothetical protein